MANVCVIGLGYIGLPAAALAAMNGHQVVGVDTKQNVIEAINAGKTHLEEPGLPEVVKTSVENGSLKASINPCIADVFIIAVPTPFVELSKEPDMSFVEAAAKSIAPHLKKEDLVILESTSPVGATNLNVRSIIEAERPELKDEVYYVYCPERAIPGKTLTEMCTNDRSIGGLTEAAAEKAVSFYKTFVTGKLLPTTAETAEMVKLVENACRDSQIAFANELSLVCDKLNLNVWDVIKLANHHPRINMLNPGPGVGGHCIAVDPWFIISSAPELTPLMQAARAVNDGKPEWVVQKVKEAIAQKAGQTVALLGLAYKPDVDDFRESPSITIAQQLKDVSDATVIVCEPYMTNSQDYKLVSLETALESDIIVMLTDHKEFKEITRGQLDRKTVIDTRGTFNENA